MSETIILKETEDRPLSPKKEKLPVFPEKELFYDQLDKAFPAESPLYEDTFDAFLEKTYGHADDDLADW